MAISERFLKQAFVDEYHRDSSSRALVLALADEVQVQLHEVIEKKMIEIVGQLRALGHDLNDYEPREPGFIALRDDRQDGDVYQCDLRLAVDTTISTGFQDTVDYDEEAFLAEFGGQDSAT